MAGRSLAKSAAAASHTTIARALLRTWRFTATSGLVSVGLALVIVTGAVLGISSFGDGVGGGSASVLSAGLATPKTTVQTTQQSFELANLAIYCGGEEIYFTATVRIVDHFSVDPNGGIHAEGTAVVDGTGTGAQTGTRYSIHQTVGTGFQENFSAAGPAALTERKIISLVVTGPHGLRYLAHATLVFTVNANGQVSADVQLDNLTCG